MTRSQLKQIRCLFYLSCSKTQKSYSRLDKASMILKNCEKNSSDKLVSGKNFSSSKYRRIPGRNYVWQIVFCFQYIDNDKVNKRTQATTFREMYEQLYFCST